MHYIKISLKSSAQYTYIPNYQQFSKYSTTHNGDLVVTSQLINDIRRLITKIRNHHSCNVYKAKHAKHDLMDGEDYLEYMSEFKKYELEFDKIFVVFKSLYDEFNEKNKYDKHQLKKSDLYQLELKFYD